MIPQCPAAWREKVVVEHRCSDGEFSDGRGIELAEYEARAGERVVALLDAPKARMRVKVGALTQWLKDGYLKTGLLTRKTSGTQRLEIRLEAEELVLGIPKTAAESSRPKYGYIHGGKETLALDNYGTTVVRFGQELLARATVIFGDSVGSTKEAGWASLAPVDPIAPAPLCRFACRDVLGAGDLTSACDPQYPYAEIHIYGPLEPSEISEVVFHGVQATPDLRRWLNVWAIPFDETDEPPR